MPSVPVLLSGRLRIGCALLALVLCIGTFGFYVVEGWTLIEAFYTTVLVHSDDLEMWLEEIAIGPDLSLAGVPIGAAQLRENAGITILAVRCAGGRRVVNPDGDVVLHTGDTLIALGTRRDLDRASGLPQGERVKG